MASRHKLLLRSALAALAVFLILSLLLAGCGGGGSSPDLVSQIAFASARDGNYEIYVMDADGSNQTNLTNNAAWDI